MALEEEARWDEYFEGECLVVNEEEEELFLREERLIRCSTAPLSPRSF